MDIVIMTDIDYIIKEWPDIASFPGVYVYPVGVNGATELFGG